jgi:hypothetical protein
LLFKAAHVTIPRRKSSHPFCLSDILWILALVELTVRELSKPRHFTDEFWRFLAEENHGRNQGLNLVSIIFEYPTGTSCPFLRATPALPIPETKASSQSTIIDRVLMFQKLLLII